MENKSKMRDIYALIGLICCTLSGKEVKLPDGVSEENIFSAAKYHGLGALAASALDRIGAATDKMRSYRNSSIRRIMLLDAERAAISKLLCEREIWHLPLKGVVLKELYPSLGDREMSDNDILFDPERRADVRDIFESRGYSTESYGGSHDDIYQKQPLYNYEMHVALFSENDSPAFSKYFADIYSKTKPDASDVLCRHLSNEDFYIYLKAHEYKHYAYSGTGIRSLVDSYIFVRKHGESLNWEYVYGELEKLGIAEYERACRALTEKLFSADQSSEALDIEARLTDNEQRMLEYFALSGTYGTEKNIVENSLNKISEQGSGAKRKYLLARIFPSMEWYEANAPFVYKHKILIPLYVVKRLVVKLVLAPGKVIRELSHVMKSKGKDKNV